MGLKYVLIIGDCREYLRILEPETINMVVTSPPYAWEYRYGEKKMQMGEIYNTRLFFQELTTVWKLCYRALTPGGYIAVVWADIQDAKKLYGKYCIEPLADGMITSMKAANFDLISQWIWRKYEPGAAVIIRPYLAYSQMATGNYIPKSTANWEYVYVWRKPSASIMPCFDVKENEWYPEYMDGVWNIPYGPEDKDPACYPIELAKRLIKIYTKPGATILDPFLGSGTTMRAALETGRNCIGIEVDRSRIARIKEKVRWGTQPLDGEIEWVIINE
jgi:DNA modification methylase